MTFRLQSELGKIADGERFKATVVYLAGLFVGNSGFVFLEKCKGLCQNFLHLMQNNHRDERIQEISLSIMQREKLNENDRQFMEVQTKEGKKFELTENTTALLIEAASAAGRRVNLDVDEVTMEEVQGENWEKAVRAFESFGWEMEDLGSGAGGGARSKMKVEARSLKIKQGRCTEKGNWVPATKVFSAGVNIKPNQLNLCPREVLTKLVAAHWVSFKFQFLAHRLVSPQDQED